MRIRHSSERRRTHSPRSRRPSCPRKRTRCGTPWARIGYLQLSIWATWRALPLPVGRSRNRLRCFPSLPRTSQPASANVTERTLCDLTRSSPRAYVCHPYMKKKQVDRRWTVMLVPHGSGSSRAVEVSQTVVKALVGIGSVLALLVLVLGGTALSRGVSVTRSRGLERENQLLASEIQRLRERLVGLRDTMNVIGEREQALRLLAGLSPIDKDVQQAGIGGPSGQWFERDSLAAAGPNGKQALAARVDMDQLTRRANILVRSLNEAYDSASSQRSRYAAMPSIMPTKGWLTSAFARERVHPILHLARPHEGIDVSAPMGMEIEAPASGVITNVAWVEGYGNMLTIDHGYGLVTRYAHCSKILVVRGQRVKRGEHIANVGSTGLSTGPHLHYEVWVNGKPVNPLKYVLPDAIVD